MLSMSMISAPEASVLLEMVRSGNEYVIAAFELYQAGEETKHALYLCIQYVERESERKREKESEREIWRETERVEGYLKEE